MGISHPLSDEYDALRGAVLSPDTTPPSSPLAHRHLLEHEVTRMDTLAGIAIKYGVEISDIKRANSLVTDSQMFAHKSLLIPLPGMPMPSLNACGQRTIRTCAPNHRQKRDAPKSRQQGASSTMNTLQRYYGLTPPQKGGNTMDSSTELSVYHKGGGCQSNLNETLLNPSAAPGTDSSWNFEAPGFSATEGDGGAPKPEQDGSMRRRQKVEAESNAQGDFLVKAIKSLLISSVRLDTYAGSPGSSQKSGFRSVTVRKSPSAPSFADADNGVSMWSSSKWTFSHDSFTRPLLDGLPKPASARRTNQNRVGLKLN
ncbi:LysM and putative peptidoglycan-binding domain-containing protein 1 [Zea mays]|uniref:LysM domain containing protein n=2 Tax=Zea mays TaxID=4577 RepID=B6SSA9_MAIZE|nr:lysM domain containing protein [Zea mays]PWZ18928.1 LysM and putative peptidoglycan-binding domain-containing protein 1 [Zea mays]